MWSCDGMVMLVDHEVVPVGTLIALIEIFPFCDWEAGWWRLR